MTVRPLADRVGTLVGSPVRVASPVGGGCISEAYRVTLADGRDLFVKTTPAAPGGAFAVEAEGLRWLGEAESAGGAPVPGVVAAEHDLLVLTWVEPGPPDAAAAESFGRALAATHRAGAPYFGASRDGFIGALPMPNAPADTWPEFYAERRVLPYLRQAVDEGSIDGADVQAVEQVCAVLDALAGPPEPPARLHGDLWSGNVHWSTETGADGVTRTYLIDPAAHGGHRETDLAVLALFGLPHLDRVLAAYDETHPLAAGWRQRAPLHQLYPLLVHAVHFGGRYGARAGHAARHALAAA